MFVIPKVHILTQYWTFIRHDKTVSESDHSLISYSGVLLIEQQKWLILLIYIYIG